MKTLTLSQRRRLRRYSSCSKLPDTTVKEKENSSKLMCREVNMTNVWNKCSKSRKVVPALMVFMQKFKENTTNESLVDQKFHPPQI